MISLISSEFYLIYIFFHQHQKETLLAFWYQKFNFYRKDQSKGKEALPSHVI